MLAFALVSMNLIPYSKASWKKIGGEYNKVHFTKFVYIQLE